MLEQNQILKQTYIHSELGDKRVMHPTGSSASTGKKRIESSLTLTSLVDCFTTILVYLLLASSFGAADLHIPRNMHLPSASNSTNLENGIDVVVNNGRYMIEVGRSKRIVPVQQLIETLREQKRSNQKNFIVVEADKNTDFSQINPAVLAGLEAGFKQVRFAVMQKDAP